MTSELPDKSLKNRKTKEKSRKKEKINTKLFQYLFFIAKNFKLTLLLSQRWLYLTSVKSGTSCFSPLSTNNSNRIVIIILFRIIVTRIFVKSRNIIYIRRSC